MKIFMRTVYADSGCEKTFGTEADIADWKAEEQEWIAEELDCSSDSIVEIGDTNNVEKLLADINKEIRLQKGL